MNSSGRSGSGKFTKSGRTRTRNFKAQFAKKIVQFEEDPFHPSLKTHTLGGVLKGLWSFRITYEYRLVFDFVDESRTHVVLIDIGSHEEV